MPYRYLEHKADLLVEATGQDFLDALESAAQGMIDFISRAEGPDSFEIEQTADILEDLVVRTLSEILSQSEIHEMAPSSFKVLNLKLKPELRLKGIVYGTKDAPTKASVKAVTYHELSVKQEDEKVTIRVLLDV